MNVGMDKLQQLEQSVLSRLKSANRLAVLESPPPSSGYRSPAPFDPLLMNTPKPFFPATNEELRIADPGLQHAGIIEDTLVNPIPMFAMKPVVAAAKKIVPESLAALEKSVLAQLGRLGGKTIPQKSGIALNLEKGLMEHRGELAADVTFEQGKKRAVGQAERVMSEAADRKYFDSLSSADQAKWLKEHPESNFEVRWPTLGEVEADPYGYNFRAPGLPVERSVERPVDPLLSGGLTSDVKRPFENLPDEDLGKLADSVLDKMKPPKGAPKITPVPGEMEDIIKKSMLADGIDPKFVDDRLAIADWLLDRSEERGITVENLKNFLLTRSHMQRNKKELELLLMPKVPVGKKGVRNIILGPGPKSPEDAIDLTHDLWPLLGGNQGWDYRN